MGADEVNTISVQREGKMNCNLIESAHLTVTSKQERKSQR